MAVIYDVEDLLNDILVLYVFTLRVLPAPLLPARKPFRDAVDRVLAISVYTDGTVHGSNTKCSLERCQLCTVVRLLSQQGFSQIPYMISITVPPLYNG